MKDYLTKNKLGFVWGLILVHESVTTIEIHLYFQRVNILEVQQLEIVADMMVRNLGSVAKIYGSLQMLVGFFLGSICISNKGYVEGIILGV